MAKPSELRPHTTDLREAISKARPRIASLLEKSLAGAELNFEEGLELTGTQDSDLAALVQTADELRSRKIGDGVTYVVNRNLNFTNICVVGCSFCGFSRGPNSRDAYFHSTELLVRKSVEAMERGATEVCIQGGLPANLDGNYYASLLRAIRSRLPQLHLHAFSPMEISYGVERTGLSLRDYLQMLQDSGLNTIPGTAAEILDDDVRRALSPNKLNVEQWIRVIRTAHQMGIRSTATMMYGHIERPEHWVRHLLLLRNIQKETGGFTEFVPLGFVHSQTRLFRKGGARAGHNRHEDLLVHSLARILLNDTIPNIQVSWVKLGFEAALACLRAGANDFSGTLMEESISKAAGANFGESVLPGELRAMIRSIRRTPVERTTEYHIRKTFKEADAEERWPAERFERGEGPFLIHFSEDRAPHMATGY